MPHHTAIRALRDALDMTKYRFIYLGDSSLKPRDFYRELLFQLGIVPQNLKSDAKRQYEHAVWDLYESTSDLHRFSLASVWITNV
uniref:Uncharacterized protein n=1 Tax=Ammonifex degensii TaxID=42838 RepID=A0A7C1JJJ5_9THEO